MKHALSVLVNNQPGVLLRVVSMFSRRAFNIDSLSVGITESPKYSRITIFFSGEVHIVDQMIKQLGKIPDVAAVQLHKPEDAVYRGMTLIKVKSSANNRLDILKIAELFRARVIDVQATTLIFEITGQDEKVLAFTRLLDPYGILEIIRTGQIALERGEQTITSNKKKNSFYGKNML
ncbi:acetolactate synthase small subunit [Pectinatus cerevisiiphilus]|uniref:Acetolactate synthase small subunit n=1 Tax=Pectinatus cerevisiiphilus TaxID=86956 RepID=A0A4R3KE65_9FIRM|nr:acetolactate synthase small subunit [Pectinatus cerevisiiphilus]TCS81390.1 acetolactate synthase small subunit [Pectinatus cerevisiiphilus]